MPNPNYFKKVSMSFSSALKNIFLVLLLLLFLPTFITGIRKNYTKFVTQKTAVGVLNIKGTLCDSTYYTKHLQEFFKDPAIKAILIKIECPGGASGTSQAIFNELLALKRENPKHVEVLVENICASGGYYIACAADHITAPGTAIIGSIGSTFSYLFQVREFMEQFKIKYASIKTGAYKSAGDPFLDLTDAEKAMLQSVTDDSYQQFIHDVSHQRALIVTDAATWANGKIFTGKQALELGLIDAIGSLQTALVSIKEKALIDTDIEWIYPPAQSSWCSWFCDEGDGILSDAVSHICSTLENRYRANTLQ